MRDRWSWSVISAMVLAGFLVTAQQGDPPMPPPGNPNHEEPLPGAFCAPPGVQPYPAHDCSCMPKCMEPHGEDEDGNQIVYPPTREEDPKCRAYCHKKFCTCPSDCV